MEDKIKKSKLETLSKMIKRKNARIKMLSQISRNSTMIRLNSFVSDLIDLLINNVIKVEPPAPTPQTTHDEEKKYLPHTPRYLTRLEIRKRLAKE